MKLNKKGFTLVELMVVIVIIGILAAIIIPNVAKNIDKANQTAAMSNAKNAYSSKLADWGAENLPKYFVYVDGDYTVLIVDGVATTENTIKVDTITDATTLTLSKEFKNSFVENDTLVYTADGKTFTSYTFKTAATSDTGSVWDIKA